MMMQNIKGNTLLSVLTLLAVLVWPLSVQSAAGDAGVSDHSGHVLTDKKTLKKAGEKNKTSAKKANTTQGVDHSQMDHGQMDHSQMDHSQMDHSQMDHGDQSMQGGAAPADVRDPHAYSGGYDFGMQPRMKMADEAYMAGLMVHRLERVKNSHNVMTVYDAQAWIGKDYDKLVIKGEGEVDDGKLHEARTELLWGHAVAAYWNTQLGVRHDSGVAPGRSWLALGMYGLAPYWFEVDATAYIGDQGRMALRLGAEYELLITQKLVLQPRIEANFYNTQDETRLQGAGLSNVMAGMRLRYEIKREFAPYVGVEWSGKYGDTAEYARSAGDATGETMVLAGLRMWY